MANAKEVNETGKMKAIVVGSMNCMPTEYAILLKNVFEEVIHYYDAGKQDTLSNPTIRWGKRSHQRTTGIVLKKIYIPHYLSYIWPRFFHFKLLSQLNSADLIILSGPSISLARLIKPAKRNIIALSYGSDISLFCNPAWPRIPVTRKRGLKGLLTPHLGFLKSKFSQLQIKGLRSCSHYSYFIEGIDPATDLLIESILAGSKRPRRLPRYSIDLDLLDSHDYIDQLAHHNGLYKLLFPVRFCEDELLGNKGWRLLFDSLNKYRSMSAREFVCVCFRKGAFSEAQLYAKEIGVSDIIEWHDVVPFDTLEQYYRSADVVIEQLGSHWIAQGLFAMALGKPVIGKVATAMQIEFFEGSGLLAVTNIDSLVNHLIDCESATYRAEVGNKSRAFVPAKAELKSEFMGWDVL